jgi:hypothetical protein
MANTALLRAVLRHLKDNPDDFDPIRWHKDFAGWTLRLAVPGTDVRKDSCDIETMFDADGNRVWIADIGPWAQRLLGLTEAQSSRLFSAMNTLDDIERLVAEYAAEVAA